MLTIHSHRALLCIKKYPHDSGQTLNLQTYILNVEFLSTWAMHFYNALSFATMLQKMQNTSIVYTFV